MDRTKPSCCRRLFDTDGTSRDEMPQMDAFDAEERRRARERWNFDFENDVPLEGRYEWVRVAPPSPPPAPGARLRAREGPGAGSKAQEGSLPTSSQERQVAAEEAVEAVMEETVRGGQELDVARTEEGGGQPDHSEQAHD